MYMLSKARPLPSIDILTSLSMETCVETGEVIASPDQNSEFRVYHASRWRPDILWIYKTIFSVIRL